MPRHEQINIAIQSLGMKKFRQLLLDCDLRNCKVDLTKTLTRLTTIEFMLETQSKI